MVMFAFATLGVCNVPLMDAVANLVLQEGFDNAEPREIASVVWAFGKLEVYNQPLFCAASSLVLNDREKLNDLTDQHIANIVWAFANLGPFLPHIHSLGLVLPCGWVA